MPLAVTQAMFRVCSARLQELFADDPSARPGDLPGLSVLVLDGKTIKHVPRRPALRLDQANAGQLLGGCGLVARDRRSAMDAGGSPNGATTRPS